MWKVEKQGEFIHLEGTLDEYADISMIENHPKPWKMDLSKINRINSIGSRNWIHFIINHDKDIEIYNASQAFMEQVVLISSMLGNTDEQDILKSYLLDFHCEKCDEEFTETIDFSQALKEKPCPKCNATAKIAEKMEEISEFHAS